MGKVSKTRRHFEIRKRKKRREKLKTLKERYLAANKKAEKEKIIEKIKKISIYLPVGEVLAVKKEEKEKSKKEKSKKKETAKKEDKKRKATKKV